MNLIQQLSQLSINLSSCHNPISNRIQVEINKTIRANEAQHVITRQHAKTHITAAVQDLKLSQDQHRIKREQKRYSEQQCDRFLESLTFPEINSRMNEVSLSHPKTFEWIFDEDETNHPWDCFAAWLKGDDQIYWINGKAGSGKSTLMKFLAGDPRTKRLAAQLYPGCEVLIVTCYLWLSGSRKQRTIKGLLCSILRQVFLNDEGLLEKLSHINIMLSTKRSNDDWSNNELQLLLTQTLDDLVCPIYIFIDGLDELDPGEDVDSLLSLIQRLSTYKKVKICVSSRPEHYIVKRLCHYRQIQLQDLTAKDMQICIRDGLEKLHTMYPSSSFDRERIVRIMTRKADGVFLWVHYVLKSVVRGMRNEDDFEDLFDRIEEMPGEMQQLYLQMWKRLNGDEDRYREEAVMYFSYMSLDSNDFSFSISVFELMVALDRRLQDTYIRDIVPQDAAGLARRCETLESRILTRCAGILEIVDGSQQADNGVRETLRDYDALTEYHCKKVKYLHRTARDFVSTTKDGQDLFGKPKESLDSRFSSMIKARMASLIQGLDNFDGYTVNSIIQNIGRFVTSGQKGLLIDFKRVCEALSVPGSTKTNIGYRTFWRSGICTDYEGVAAFTGCVEYVRHFIENRRPSVSPYYLGFLVRCATEGIKCHRWFSLDRILSLISWLILQGADILTRHSDTDGNLDRPVAEFLLALVEIHKKDFFSAPQHKDLAKQAIEIIRQLLPFVTNSAKDCCMKVLPTKQWSIVSLVLERTDHYLQLVVQVSVAQLCHLTMLYLSNHCSSKSQWK